MFDLKTFCEKLKDLRLEKQLSIAALGKKLEVSGSTIMRWENGTIIPSIENLYKIARFFDVTADYLIGLKN